VFIRLPVAVLVAVILFIEARAFRQHRDWTPETAGADRDQLAKTAAPVLERVIS
jgi:hypothetical protein